MRPRLVAAGVMLACYLCSVALGAWTAPGYAHASGLCDLGHRAIPPLLPLVGREATQWVFWLGTLPLELCFAAIAIAVLATGRGIRLGCCLYVAYLLHWLCLHATTLPPPDDSVWQFPPGVPTLGRPYPNDFWFSGHTANAVLIALATGRRGPAVRTLAWGFAGFQVLLVLATRTHYTIDVIGGIVVAYALHRASLDVAAALERRSAAPAAVPEARPG